MSKDNAYIVGIKSASGIPLPWDYICNDKWTIPYSITENEKEAKRMSLRKAKKLVENVIAKGYYQATYFLASEFKI